MFPPRWKWDLLSSEMLRSVTYASYSPTFRGKTIDPIFKVKAVQEDS